jgi:Bifunctional DNA primase/polymerase, N-terminal
MTGEVNSTLASLSLLGAALGYARQGVRVLPCREINTAPPGEDNSKAPYTRNGFHDASTNPKQIADWWIQHPDALIGGVVPDDLLVIDLDPRKIVLSEQTRAAAEEFCFQFGGNVNQRLDDLRTCRLQMSLENLTGEPLTDTLQCVSGRGDGGTHYYYKRPPGKFTSTRLPAGVDLKVGGKGYCILPPSPHPVTGKPYRWITHPIAAMHSTLWQLLIHVPREFHGTTEPNEAQLAGILRKVSEEANTRNNLVFWGACRLVEYNYPREAFTALYQAGISTGLPGWEVRKAIRSAINALGGES